MMHEDIGSAKPYWFKLIMPNIVADAILLVFGSISVEWF